MLEAGAALQGLRHIKGVISAGYPSTLILLPLANRILFDKQFNGKPESMRFQYLASNAGPKNPKNTSPPDLAIGMSSDF